MSFSSLTAIVLLLALEPAFYLFVNHRSVALARAFEGSDPVRWIRRAFFAFKVLQFSIFAAWCWHFGEGEFFPSSMAGVSLLLGALLLTFGQVLNFAVFRTLGWRSVFYGRKYGHSSRWVEGFPYNLLPHPQYVGTLLSIWGVFLAVRFPHPDWWQLPAIETPLYLAGASLESGGFGAVLGASVQRRASAFIARTRSRI